jgi:hypothetical protein
VIAKNVGTILHRKRSQVTELVPADGSRIRDEERTLQQLITLKCEELYAVEELLRPQPVAWARFSLMRPDEWVQRLAEVNLLHDYAGRLAESFDALVRAAHVPHERATPKSISDIR